MGNQEIADFHFFFLSYIINLHQAGFFYPPSLSLSPPCKSNIIIHHTENARNVCCDTPYDPRRVYDSLGFHYRLALESAVHTSPLKRLNISPDFPMHLKEPHAAPLIGGFGGASVPSSQEVL